MNVTRRRLARRASLILAMGAALGLGFGSMAARGGEDCPRCDWSLPKTRATTRVRNMNELRRALAGARPSSTIILENGEYRLDGAQLDVAVPQIVLRGRSSDPSRVVIRGRGYSDAFSAISISAPGVTVANLAVTGVGYHGVQVRGEKGASGAKIHNVHVIDVGQQLIKGSSSDDSPPCRDGLVSCSTLEYSDSAPSDYTNGIDVLNGWNWTVRNNILRKIRGPQSQNYRAGPAILFWRGSRDTLVERNLVIDCHRGIALGLSRPKSATAAPDHSGGIVRRNAVCNLNAWADEGIEINGSPGVQVEHNTVFVQGEPNWAIGVRFANASAVVRHNLCNRAIVRRDGAKATLIGNFVDAREDWFVDARRGDLRLARGDLPPVDAAEPSADEGGEAGARSPRSGSAPDVGAFEYRGSAQ